MHSCKQTSTVAEYLNVAFWLWKRKGNIFNCTKKPVKGVGSFGRVTVKLHVQPKCIYVQLHIFLLWIHFSHVCCLPAFSTAGTEVIYVCCSYFNSFLIKYVFQMTGTTDYIPGILLDFCLNSCRSRVILKSARHSHYVKLSICSSVCIIRANP